MQWAWPMQRTPVADSNINLKARTDYCNVAFARPCSSVADGRRVFWGQFFWVTLFVAGPIFLYIYGQNLISIFSGTYIYYRHFGFVKGFGTQYCNHPVTIDANAGIDTLVCPGSSVAISDLIHWGKTKYRWYQLPNNYLNCCQYSKFQYRKCKATLLHIHVGNHFKFAQGCLTAIRLWWAPIRCHIWKPRFHLFSTVTIGGGNFSQLSTVTQTPAFGLADANLENRFCNAT